MDYFFNDNYIENYLQGGIARSSRLLRKKLNQGSFMPAFGLAFIIGRTGYLPISQQKIPVRSTLRFFVVFELFELNFFLGLLVDIDFALDVYLIYNVST